MTKGPVNSSTLGHIHTYGKEAYGITPTQLAKLRAMAAEAVSTKTAGQCATTLIWIMLGQEQDPAIKIVGDQIRMWFYLMNSPIYHEDPEAVSLAWWRAKTKYYTADNPWATIKGPMGATIGTLDHCGWVGITPFKWLDGDGAEWQYVKGADITALIDAVKESAGARVWRDAARHHNGKGLEDGADITGLQKQVKSRTL